MIPKKIHYCWFGGNPLDELGKKCLMSWKKFLPDYEIIEWNESNFDVNCCQYVKEAYEAKKWAFVSDYARFKILYEEGGIYFDTDVEVIKPLDDIIARGNFMGAENRVCDINNEVSLNVAPGLGLGVTPGLSLIKEVLDSYDKSSFLNDDGTFNLTTVVARTTGILRLHGLQDINEIQNVADITIYPSEYFCPKDWKTDRINVTENTCCIHHFSASWYGEKEKNDMERWKFCNNKKISLIEKYGKEKGLKKYYRWRNRWKLKQYFKDGGMKLIIHKFFAKLKTVFERKS
ncbi:MAG: glycosyl transferase [Oscillospiraceae bacterium]|nr:glycosyl transferase [Oscillospiraceae bacterium]